MHDLTLTAFPFLASLAASESPKDRRIWLRVASDHFVATHHSDPEAIERFVDAMTSRLVAADVVTRLEIARKLAPCARTPLRLLAEFESLDSEASDFVLQHAVAYDARALAQAAARGDRRAIAVAKRKNLDPQLVEILAERDDIDVSVALAGNDSASLEGGTLMQMLRQARRQVEQKGDRRLAEALLERRPVRCENAALFLLANSAQRAEILLAIQRAHLGRPTSSYSVGLTTLDELELAAVARQPDRFVAILSNALGCDSSLARQIVEDSSGEPLAVALAALGAANEVVVRVLIANDLLAGASYQRIRALARLNNALDRTAATHVIAALRGEPLVRGRYQPLADPLATRAPSRAASARPATVGMSSMRLPPANGQERIGAR